MVRGRSIYAFAALSLALALLVGCSPGEDLAATINPSEGPSYVTGGRAIREYLPADRAAPVEYAGESDAGGRISSSDFSGKVHVINFWYAGCAPCLKEAPILETVVDGYAGRVPFVGVNTYDQAATARALERRREVSYRSVIDVNSASVQLAFASSIPPNAVPTTLVIDRDGRVAARISGMVESPATLKAVIDRVLQE